MFLIINAVKIVSYLYDLNLFSSQSWFYLSQTQSNTDFGRGCSSERQLEARSWFPRPGVLATGPQETAIRARVPSLFLPSQERIQSRRQNVKNNVKKFIETKRACGKGHGQAQRESCAFGKFKSCMKGLFSPSVSSLRPSPFLSLPVNLSQDPPLECACVPLPRWILK